MKKKQGNQKRGCGGKKNSVQELLSIQYFTKYGLMTEHGEMVFFQIAPTNISVLSYENIERKINHLQGLISMHPDMEIVCTDSCECFDGNREYLAAGRWKNPTDRSAPFWRRIGRCSLRCSRRCPMPDSFILLCGLKT